MTATLDLAAPGVRDYTRTGERSAARGRTEHVRPAVPGHPARAAGHVTALPLVARIRRRGPVAGCTPTACHHVYPHWAWTGGQA